MQVTSRLVVFEIYASVAQWIARQTSNLKVVGSTPIRGAFERVNASDKIVLAESNYIADDFINSISHGSSVGRAGDCNSHSAVIPRPVVRFRPVRFLILFVAVSNVY